MNKYRVKQNVCLGLFFLFVGIEYAVILPTINGYLITLDAGEYFLGIVLSSFSFAAMIAAPIHGHVADRIDTAKYCIMVGNMFEVAGNLVYFMSSNKNMVLAGRLIAGLGSGAIAAIFGIVSKRTTVKERTAIFSLLMSLRQFGNLIGPAFNVFLEKLNFTIGKFPVDKYTSPGLLMAIMWTIHTILILILYNDKPPDCSINIDENGTVTAREWKHNEEIKDSTSTESSLQTRGKCAECFEKFLREEVIICFICTFVLMFVQTGLETVLTPMTLLYFKWESLQNSILFCVIGVIVITSFIILGFMSKRRDDRFLMLVGFTGLFCAFVMFLTYTSFATAEDGDPAWLFPVFCANTVGVTFFLPFAFVPQAALLSKVTKTEHQGFTQGIRTLFLRAGQIFGPNWASGMSTPTLLPVMVAVDVILIIMALVMICLSYSRLIPRHVFAINYDADCEDEKKPLIQD